MRWDIEGSLVAPICTGVGGACNFVFEGSKAVAQSAVKLVGGIGIEQEVSYQKLLRTNSIPCSSVVLKTEVAREFYMCHDELHEDYILWLKVLKKYGNAAGINEPLLKSRMSPGGKSRNKMKSAQMQYGVYRYMGIGRIRSLLLMCSYMVHGILKYL